jgi:hypothetical protein
MLVWPEPAAWVERIWLLMNGPLFDVCWIGGGSLSAAVLWKAFHAGWFTVTKRPDVQTHDWMSADDRAQILQFHAIKSSPHHPARAGVMRIGDGR